MGTRKFGASALMKALYNRIDTGALTSTYSIYNFTPRSATFPYVSFGSPIGVRSTMISTRDTEGEDNSVTVHVWSDKPGDKEAADMLNNIIQTVLGTDLDVYQYFAPVFAYLDYSEISVDTSDPNRPIRHGIARFRFHMAPS